MASRLEEQDAVRKVDNSLLSAAIQLTLIADLMARSVASGSLEFISSNSPLSEMSVPDRPREREHWQRLSRTAEVLRHLCRRVGESSKILGSGGRQI